MKRLLGVELAAIVVLTLVASSGFARVFSGHGYVGPLLGAAIVQIGRAHV